MWVLIISELLVFGAFLLGFGIARIQNPEIFHTGQATLDIRLGALNTILLVTSGWFAALAVQVRERGDITGSRRKITLAMLLGAAFLVIKGIEYADKINHGLDIETDTFFTLYYLITGFHAMHVVMGMIILAIVSWKNTTENLETGAAFWHMVDLIWLIVFPIFYLVR